MKYIYLPLPNEGPRAYHYLFGDSGTEARWGEILILVSHCEEGGRAKELEPFLIQIFAIYCF